MALPPPLINKNLGFVKLGHRSKVPVEKGWVRKPVSIDVIRVWLAKGGNYGVACGRGDLIIIDADTPELVAALKTLPRTFTCKTPKKGIHKYYFCPGFGKKIVLIRDGKHYGEILGRGSQAVGPGSIHPDTQTAYEVEDDAPISTIERGVLLNALSEFLPSKHGQSISDHGVIAINKLIEDYGRPYFSNKEGRVTQINESFWAALHSLEHIELFVHKEGAFYRYNSENGLYEVISEDRIKQEVSRRLLEASRESGETALERKRGNQSLGNIVAQLRGICEADGAFQKEEKFVHLKNGIVVFHKSGSADFYSFSPDFVSRNQCPIKFDPKAKCPKFLNDFLRPAVSKNDALILQKYAGMVLLGNNLMQRMLVLDGPAARGKSTWSLILQALVGHENVTELRTACLGERFELSRYLGKTLLVGVDVPGNFLMQKSVNTLKGLLGGDNLDTEKKGRNEAYKLEGNLCIVITANNRLHLLMEGDASAWKRRLLLIPFHGPVPKRKIPNFDKYLIEHEGPGILNWALEGLSLLLDDISKSGDVALDPEQIARIDRLIAESDSISCYLKDRVEAFPGQQLAVNDLLAGYAAYCNINNWTPKPTRIVEHELEGFMRDLFGASKSKSISGTNGHIRGYRNVRFKRG